ncbi:hypothetical protein [Hymenobacter terrigena]
MSSNLHLGHTNLPVMLTNLHLGHVNLHLACVSPHFAQVNFHLVPATITTTPISHKKATPLSGVAFC